MAEYDLIQTESEIAGLLGYLAGSGCRRFALDVEGENNLHCYGIHVALIQLFDGKRAFAVDVLALKSAPGLRDLLEDPPAARSGPGGRRLKVMFDASNDMLAFQHDLGMRPAPILDVAIAARLLGKPGSLEALVAEPRVGRSKSRLQKSNWMRRPMARPLLDYAVSDVFPLLDLADSLMAEIDARGLRAEFDEQNARRQDKIMEWKPLLNFRRIPGYGRMNDADKRLARVLWYAREYHARALDLPPEAVASKVELGELVGLHLRDAGRIVAHLNGNRTRFRLGTEEFARSLRDAERDVERDGR